LLLLLSSFGCQSLSQHSRDNHFCIECRGARSTRSHHGRSTVPPARSLATFSVQRHRLGWSVCYRVCSVLVFLVVWLFVAELLFAFRVLWCVLVVFVWLLFATSPLSGSLRRCHKRDEWVLVIGFSKAITIWWCCELPTANPPPDRKALKLTKHAMNIETVLCFCFGSVVSVCLA
jgi:hypothetical protein